MKLFKTRSQRISVDFAARIYLQDKEDGSLSNNWQQGQIVTISKDGASIIVDKIVLDGQHLFFSAQQQAEKLLYLSHLENETRDEQQQLTAEAIWMDSCTHNGKSAFKIGLRFTDDQKDLFESFKGK
ncbi:MAG: hypothetical protein QNJ17_14315 [Desulfocapsaceae bacterium]|nr:hypothetical protein [Desulfocapsaceae bacterium]